MAGTDNQTGEEEALASRTALTELRAREIEARARRIEAEIRLLKATTDLETLRKNVRQEG